jgi:uridine phosphorylase
MAKTNSFSKFVYKLYSFNLTYRESVSWWKNSVLRKNQYHIGLRKGSVGANVVMVETPDQVRQIAAYFKKFEVMADHREYLSAMIHAQPVDFVVISTGIGTPPIAIGMEELSIVGVKNFIYIGSGKPLRPDNKEGDIVIVKAAAKEDGTSQEYLPMLIPAVGNIELINAARKVFKKNSIKFQIGITATVDLDPYHIPDAIPLQVDYDCQMQKFMAANVAAVDRSCAGVYAVATKLHKPACCILQMGEAESPVSDALIKCLPELFIEY